jgi:Arc/MetJ-type ribon-helix-helix transcriptional regulator
MMAISEKVRTGVYISSDLLDECDEYLSKNRGSRSELIESALRLYLATRKIKDKSEVLVPELAECISAASDEGITKISKGLFRYAVEVEMLIALLAETFEVSKNHLKDVRREAVNNVRRTRGKVNLDDLIMRNEREGIVDNDDSPIQGLD